MNEKQKETLVELRVFIKNVSDGDEESRHLYVLAVIESYLNELEEAEHGPQLTETA